MDALFRHRNLYFWEVMDGNVKQRRDGAQYKIRRFSALHPRHPSVSWHCLGTTWVPNNLKDLIHFMALLVSIAEAQKKELGLSDDSSDDDESRESEEEKDNNSSDDDDSDNDTESDSSDDDDGSQ